MSGRVWNSFIEHPKVVALRRRYASQIAFIEARLSPEGYLGLQLTVGAAVLIAAAWLFGAIAEDVVTRDPLTVIDARVAGWLHSRAAPSLTRAMLLVSYLGAPAVVVGISLVAALLLAWRRHWYRLLTLLVAVPGGSLLNVLVKHAFGRPRPVFDDPLLTLDTYSFPSGHALGATVLYGLLAAFAVWKVRAWRRCLLVAAAAGGLLILLVCFSRIYLGVHYLSDVLGGIAEGVAWLALCLTAVSTLRRRHLRRAAASRQARRSP